MNAPIAAWHEEHAYFSRLLDQLQKQLDLFHAGGSPNYELMLDIVSYLRDYGDQCHHPREDEAFGRLARRCPELALELARLSQEHRVIATAGDALSALLKAVALDSVVPREQVEAAAATYLVYYRNHLAAEESQALARAAGELDAGDWEAIRRRVPAGNAGAERHRELRRRIAAEA